MRCTKRRPLPRAVVVREGAMQEAPIVANLAASLPSIDPILTNLMASLPSIHEPIINAANLLASVPHWPQHPHRLISTPRSPSSLLSSGLGIIYFISFLSIASQIRALAGRSGIAPLSALLRQIKHDFPFFSRHLHFPSLFWITGASDAALLLVPILGALCALAVAIGYQSEYGEASIFCWIAMRSLDLPVGLLYPWDSLLLEAGALALLLPAPPPVWIAGLAMDKPCHPWAAASFRWLLARLMLGFGKKKFAGTSSKHSCYIKNFLIAQPIPSPFGWLGYRLPLPLFQLSLVIMFLVECVAPFFLLAPGIGRLIAASSIATLMAGIQAGGNFGYFNLLTITLCLGCLDTTSSVYDELPPLETSYDFATGSAADFFGAIKEPAIRAALLTHTALSLIYILFDSWCSTSWTYWPQLAIARKAWVRMLLTLCRSVADHRLLHAYGVFPPQSNPPIRMAPVLEGSHDGVTWKRYEWRYLVCAPHSRPRFVAPHHPRLDHSLFYVSFGTGPENLLSTINSARPYAFGRDSMLHRIGTALLSGASSQIRSLFRVDAFPADDPLGPPLFVRARLMAYEPLDTITTARTGDYWSEICIDQVHLPTMVLAWHAVRPRIRGGAARRGRRECQKVGWPLRRGAGGRQGRCGRRNR